MVKKQDLETALNGADVQALETLSELIAEQLDYLKENSFEEWNKIVYKRCSARIAELK